MLDPPYSYVALGAFFLAMALLGKQHGWRVGLVALAGVCFVFALLPREKVTFTAADVYWMNDSNRHEGVLDPSKWEPESKQFWVTTTDGKRYRASYDAHKKLVEGQRFECTLRGESFERCVSSR